MWNRFCVSCLCDRKETFVLKRNSKLGTFSSPTSVRRNAKRSVQDAEFTLLVLWSNFLVTASETVVNGSAIGGYDLQLDKFDDNWAQKLPLINYASFSDAHRFFRPNYTLYGGNRIGRGYCQEPNVMDLCPGFAIQRAIRAVFTCITDCKYCSGIAILLRTFSPSHFGTWNTGGNCNRTNPLAEEEIHNRSFDWNFRNIQLEEIERAKKWGEKKGNTFDVLDTTGAMLMRSDGHLGEKWGNKWMKVTMIASTGACQGRLMHGTNFYLSCFGNKIVSSSDLNSIVRDQTEKIGGKNELDANPD